MILWRKLHSALMLQSHYKDLPLSHRAEGEFWQFYPFSTDTIHLCQPVAHTFWTNPMNFIGITAEDEGFRF